MRLFLALDPPVVVKDRLGHLAGLMAPHLASVRWLGASSLHVTVRFLGDMPVEAVPAIGRIMAEGVDGLPAMALTCQGWGVFPNVRGARVVWVGLSGEGLHALHGLAKFLAEHLPGDDKAFFPHLTVGRVSRPLALPPAWEQNAPFAPMPWTATELLLVRSILTPHGSRYQVVHRVGFGA